MAAGTHSVECPDPSVHERDHRLQDQASKAALYVTHPETGTDVRKTIPALGPDGKLSSAGAAASLKHAQPHELPSFPTVGIDSSVSGNRAANLAHANQKPFEHWKPDLSSTAGKAALLAHKDGGKLDLWQPSASSTGNSAAGIAMGKQLSPQLDYGYTEDGKKKALLAATLSVSGRAKPPPKSASPPNYPDAENASANALNAATVAHRPSPATSPEPIRVSDAANEASRITHLGPNVNREMFTSHPKFEDDDAAQKQALRGATLSVERDRANKAKELETEPPLMGGDTQTVAKNYLALQEQAHKLAQERLSKLDPDGVTAYREHYGYGNSPPRSKLSVRSRHGRSGSKEQDEDEEDAAAARRIRHQMTQFTDSLADADTKKRQKDRSSVLAAAERNVRERMSTIDQDIFDQTGKVTPQMMEQWEAKARAKAAGESEKRLENHGMVHIGGGKYMDQSEITAIAQGRMQPTLDEINENAEKQRERDEEIRAAQEERRRVAAEEKQAKEDEKMQAKFEKAQEKQHYKELKDQEKEEKRQQKEQRKRQDQDWKREQDEAKLKSRSEETTAKELNVAGSGYSAKASGSPAQEEGTAAGSAAAGTAEASTAVASPSAEGLKREVTAGEAAATKASAEDPPGVPTDLGQENPHTESGAFQGDSGSIARRAENDEKLEAIGAERAPTEAKKAKRESRVRSFFGKFKRNSRSIDSEPAKKDVEAPATVKNEETSEKPAKETTQSVASAHNSTVVGGNTAGAAVAGGAVAAGTAAHESKVAPPEESEKDEASAQDKKDEFHKAVTTATDNEAEEGLYSAPSAEVKVATAVPITVPAAVPVAEVAADPGTPSGTWASSTQHDIEERGNSVDVSRPSTAIPTHTSTTDTAATAPERISTRNSVATTSDEYEEARDKFDEDDSHETATLKAPEPPHPARPTSKFQEELED